MQTTGCGHIATLLATGAVLVAGGAGSMDSSGNTPELASAELYTPIADSSVVLLSQPSRVVATSTLNFDPHENAISNGALVRPGTAGQVCIDAGHTAAYALLDITGYLSS